MATSYNILFAEGIELDLTSTSQKHELGVPAIDQYGNYFQYHQGVASTTKGDVVQIAQGGTTALLTTALMASARYRPLGVACSANVASQYGWYIKRLIRNPNSDWQLNVLASCAAFVPLYTSATAGSLDDTATEAGRVAGAHLQSAQNGTAGGNTTAVFDWLGYTSGA